METDSSTQLYPRINRKLAYLRSLIAVNGIESKYAGCLDVIQNGLKSTYQGLVKSIVAGNAVEYFLEGQLLTLKKLKREIEAEIILPMTAVHATLQKYNLKKRPLLEIFDKYRTPTKNISDFRMTDINFPIISLRTNEIESLAIKHLLKYSATDDEDKIYSLVKNIRLGYNTIFYHNFTHGFGVMQFFYHLWDSSEKLKQILNDEDIFISSIACLAHDLGHKGVNNGFHLAGNSELACMSHENGVMEHYHAAKLLQLLGKKENDILSERFKDPAAKKEARDRMVYSIMSTDMSRHFKFIGDFASYNGEFISGNQEHKKFLSGILTHASDLNNPCLEFDNYMSWAVLITQEFSYQTMAEESHGYPVTQMFVFRNEKAYLSGQIFFSEKIVYPLMKELDSAFNLRICSGIESNIKRIKEEIEGLGN